MIHGYDPEIIKEGSIWKRWKKRLVFSERSVQPQEGQRQGFDQETASAKNEIKVGRGWTAINDSCLTAKMRSKRGWDRRQIVIWPSIFFPHSFFSGKQIDLPLPAVTHDYTSTWWLWIIITAKRCFDTRRSLRMKKSEHKIEKNSPKVTTTEEESVRRQWIYLRGRRGGDLTYHTPSELATSTVVGQTKQVLSAFYST